MSTTRGTRTEQSLGRMVAGVGEDLSALVREQVALTKAEVRESAQTAARSSALLVVAGVLAFLGFVFLLVTLAYVLIQLGLAPWAGFGIVTLLLLVVAGILGAVGARRLRTVKAPERAIEQAKESRALLTHLRP